jgi:hypothetical protein
VRLALAMGASRSTLKWGFFLLGFFIGLFWIVGAIRLAKTHSWWARKNYAFDGRKMRQAMARHEGVYAIDPARG